MSPAEALKSADNYNAVIVPVIRTHLEGGIIMLDKISINAHSSICIDGEPKIYIDPYMMREEPKDADIVFITHDHFDHLSKEDLEKVCKEDTVVVVPESCADSAVDAGVPKTHLRTMNAGDVLELGGVSAEGVPAYNIKKEFHPKKNGWLGYVLTIDDTRIYIAGDTDDTAAVENVKCDIAMVPIGGTYTMNAVEAASVVNKMKPKTVIPTHYGSVVGEIGDENKFMEKIDPDIWVAVKI